MFSAVLQCGMREFIETMEFWRLIAVVFVASSLSSATWAHADEPYQGPIFDAHVHYSDQVWDAIDAEAALRLLGEAGITGVLMSSTPDEGTVTLMEQPSPIDIVPFFRPYKQSKDRAIWFKNPENLKSAKDALDAGVYAGFGEVHIHAPINIAEDRVRDLIRLVADEGLFIHAHANHRVITRIYEIAPDAKIIWAHAGFDPPDVIGWMMDKYDTLWADLSLREFGALYDEGIIDIEGIDPDWKALLIRHVDRFMIGSDTWDIGRWRGLKGIIDENRMWLGHLPKDIADQIAHKNGERLFGRRR
jgi:hypothetical protein